jgi:glycosyltransferase involved in cell wall biosynthesis
MQGKFKFIPKEKRKNILLMCDDIRMHSGIATMAREFVVGTAHHYNWFNVGAAIDHPDAGKVFDITADVNKIAMIEDSDVKVMPFNGYGNALLVRQLLKENKYDAILIFTDPRYWVWLFDIEREVRSKIPIMWLNIWDEYPAPMYNKNFYNSVDVLLSISKQTKNINEIVLGPEAKGKLIEYVPHGINENEFYPIGDDHFMYNDLIEFKKKTIPVEDLEFTVFFNSRNIHRKHPADLILAYQRFCELIGPERAKKCALVMHTQSIDKNGTNLKEVKDTLTDPAYTNIFFSQSKITPPQMNLLYNMADVTALISSNEGWGLSLTESMMTGKMIIANTTGGMQDQMRFTKEGKWIDFTPNFPSNHRGTVKEHGEWAVPVYPKSIGLSGSVPTPYIFDSRCDIEDVANAIKEVYDLSPTERMRRGMKGREWVTSDESQMSAANMCKNIINVIDRGLETFTPRTKVDVIKVEDTPQQIINHKLFDY